MKTNLENYYYHIITFKDAKEKFENGFELWQIFDDDSETKIENENDFNDCKESKTEIGVRIYY
jgi:hypothetical protein